jgi:cytokinesis protein
MSEGKSRQSSAGKSFFSRKKDKGGDGKSFDDALSLESPGGAASAAGSKSSRHSYRPNSMSLDMDHGADVSGLSMTAGVITTIPYDSLSQDNRTPVPIDYLPKNDQVPMRKEPLPHHLNKGGVDFHQYPAWEPQKTHQTYTNVRDTQLPNGSSNTGAPRPPPHGSQSSASSRERPLPPRPPNMGSATSGQSGNAYQRQSESPSRGRNSFDQASIYSSVSSTTRGSSIFSSDNSSRTAIPPHMHDNSFRPTSSQSSIRQSNSGWSTHQSPSFNSAASFAPEGFHLQRPADDSVVEAQFLALMQKRGWQNLPEQARRQMIAYPIAKKWTLVHQDRLTEWQGEQKRRQHVRQTLGTHDGVPGLLARADEEGSPEWYVKKVMEDSLSQKQLQSLVVSLRTQPIR